MVDHKNVYLSETGRYHELVSYEDFLENLANTINTIIGHQTISILETGAGTGRLASILAPLSNNLACFDISPAMLQTAAQVTKGISENLIGFAAADHRWLPIKGQSYDLLVAGWSVCYLSTWQTHNWISEVNLALMEFLRVLKPTGKILLIETLGTGKTEPDPPSHLVPYLDYLDSLGFMGTCIRTDYKFPDSHSATNLTEFFFGKEMLQFLSANPQPVLPECTGLWIIDHQELLKNLSVRNP